MNKKARDIYNSGNFMNEIVTIDNI